ncbi:MAG: peroxiredoxin-like family protein [Egibacteraceae bacterium]
MFCREQVAQLRAVQDDITRAGVGIAAVGTGDPAYARDFKATTDIAFPLLVDDTRASYRAVEAGRTSLVGLARPTVIARSVRALARGVRQGRPGQAQLMLSATHLIRPEGTVAFAWRGDTVADTPPVDTVLDALTEFGSMPR